VLERPGRRAVYRISPVQLAAYVARYHWTVRRNEPVERDSREST
jgi:hypothetical protein